VNDRSRNGPAHSLRLSVEPAIRRQARPKQIFGDSKTSQEEVTQLTKRFFESCRGGVPERVACMRHVVSDMAALATIHIGMRDELNSCFFLLEKRIARAQ
jgi:hypothetical protein